MRHLISIFVSFFLCGIAVAEETIDTCRMCVLYKYYIATFNREQKAVTDTVKSILEIGDHVAKYGDHRA